MNQVNGPALEYLWQACETILLEQDIPLAVIDAVIELQDAIQAADPDPDPDPKSEPPQQAAEFVSDALGLDVLFA